MADPVDVRHWFIFGTDPATGLVDVSDGEDDVLTRIPQSLAKAIIAYRDVFVTEREAWHRGNG